MDFRLLGPLEISDGGQIVRIGGPKQRTVLAHLLLQANRVVTVDRLIDAIWGEEPPPAARNTVQTYIRHLRRAVGAERIEHRSSGYVLTAGIQEVDALRFEALLDTARGLGPSDPGAAVETLREALGLWRGPPLDDLAHQASLAPEIARLEELRVAAVEERVGAELELGRHAELVPELETMVGAHPLRERIWAHLMIALYRSGRQGEALAAYGRARELLARELGIDPSPELQRLHEQILRQDPLLEVGGEPLRGYRLLEQLGTGSFGSVHRAFQPQAGREVAVKVIHAQFANHPEFIRRFEAEAQLVARLEHPHVVPLYDYWREPDGAYLVMRYLRGGSLGEVLTQGPLGADRTARLLGQVAPALTAAHRQGVIHRRLKPENVLFDEEGNAYLSDFGIASDLAVAEATGPGGMPTSFASSLSPEEIRGDPATPATDVYGLGLLLFEALAGRHPFTDARLDEVLDKHLRAPLPSLRAIAPELPQALEQVIERATAKDPADRYVEPSELVAAFGEALAPGTLGVQLSPVGARNPYKGLRPFLEADAADFFGRDALVERLLARMGETGSGSRFLAVVGPSGSGKSSLVRAGLVPTLKAGGLPGSDGWFVVEMTPGSHPFEELGASLMTVAVDPPPDMVERLERDEAGLLRTAEEILPPRSELLLIIDQFEEVFTLAGDEDRRRFLATLVDAATDPGTRIRVVVTLRADFYDRPLSHQGFGDLLAARTEAVTPLSPRELERTVSGPAERAGVRIEPQLLAEIVADVAVHPGALPLLQYALTELFEWRRDSALTVEAYREIKGVSGALARRAEDLYGRLNQLGRDACRQLFLRLVTLGEDGSADTRRRVPRVELTSLEVDREAMESVIDLFGSRRLLSFDRDPMTRGPTVEVAHEALLTEWGRLRGWVEAAREDVRAHRRLLTAAREWAAAGRDPSFLLRGARLARFEAWAGTAGLALTDEERDYVEHSLARQEEERAAEEARRVRETQLEKRSVSRLRALVLVLALASLLASALSLFAFDQRREVQQQNLRSRGRELVLLSIENLESDPHLSLLLALRAVELTAVERGLVLPEAVDAVHWALQNMGVQFPVDAPVIARTGPDGLRGVFDLPLQELLPFAHEQIDRGFTADECRRYLNLNRCPPPRVLGDLTELTLLDRTGEAVASGERPLAGTQVRVASTLAGRELLGWKEEVARFETATGIRIINVEQAPEDLVGEMADDADADLQFLSTPGDLPSLWEAGEVMDLGAYLDMDQVRRDYAPHLLRLATIGEDASWPADSGSLVAGWMKLAVKSLVWYPVPDFEEAGYEIPQTWDQLVALSDRMVADGRTPWCFGIQSDGVTGWPATDWVEELLLRTAGPRAYDRWVAHEIPFTHPEVRRAADLMGRIAFTPRYVAGGNEAIAKTPFWAAQTPMFANPPGCWLHRQASFAPVDWPRGRVAGIDSTAFPFPPMERGDPPALLGAGDVFVVFSDRPEVRELARFLMSPDFGTAWAEMPDGGYISPNLRFDLEAHGNEVTRAQAEEVVTALEADTFRFDGSDLMPPDIGLDAFLEGMAEYLSRGPESLDEVLATIEKRWPAKP